MSFMFEVYYKAPANHAKETALADRVAAFGGRLDYREDATERTGICLTYEFDDREKATKAAEVLRQLGEYVEGPMDYAAWVEQFCDSGRKSHENPSSLSFEC